MQFLPERCRSGVQMRGKQINIWTVSEVGDVIWYSLNNYSKTMNLHDVELAWNVPNTQCDLWRMVKKLNWSNNREE